MMKCGLLGEKLKHSYSPAIHSMFGGYEYVLFEKNPEELEAFIKEDRSWSGLNVTIPYKKAVVPFMDEISETVKNTGSLNTVVRRADGSLYGDNTDVYGFVEMVKRSGINAAGKKALVLGNGGAAASVIYALESMGAEVVVISRSGENNYCNLDRHADAAVIVNTTPLGMYPNVGVSAVDLKFFPKLEGVLDIVYNPARTEILLQAEELGIPFANGLYMLVAQAKRSSELFANRSIEESEILRVTKVLAAEMQNIILTGDDSANVAAELSEMTGKEILSSAADLESLVENCKQSKKIVVINARLGEAEIRPAHQNGVILDGAGASAEEIFEQFKSQVLI